MPIGHIGCSGYHYRPAFHNVLEFRHPSWWEGHVYHTLARPGTTFCGQSHPHLPDEVVRNAPLLYYRLHGTPELYKSPYSEGYLHQVITQIQAVPHI